MHARTHAYTSACFYPGVESDYRPFSVDAGVTHASPGIVLELDSCTVQLCGLSPDHTHTQHRPTPTHTTNTDARCRRKRDDDSHRGRMQSERHPPRLQRLPSLLRDQHEMVSPHQPEPQPRAGAADRARCLRIENQARVVDRSGMGRRLVCDLTSRQWHVQVGRGGGAAHRIVDRSS